MNMLQIRNQDPALVVPSYLQGERFYGVVSAVSDHPINSGADEFVDNRLILVEDQIDFRGFGTREQVREIGVFNAGERIQVRVNLSIQLIFLHVVVEFRHLVELVDVAFIFQVTP